MPIAKVALDVAIDDWFDYHLSFCHLTQTRTYLEQACFTPISIHGTILVQALGAQYIGARVAVAFAKRRLVGVVVAIDTHSDLPSAKIRTATPIDNSPFLPLKSMDFAHFLARYYRAPLGFAIFAMLPKHIADGQKIIPQDYLLLPSADAKLTPAQKRLWQSMQAASIGGRIYSGFFSAHKSLDVLLQKKLVRAVCATRMPYQQITPSLTLNSAQQKALFYITDTPILKAPIHKIHYNDLRTLTFIPHARYRGVLLDGITGSGKTEVYLQAMAKVLAQGKQVLVLVPEIALSAQIVSRIRTRFLARIVALNSKASDNERAHGCMLIKQNLAHIVIGTRSCLLYPFANLGLIIVDEAHDTSYKQEEGVRYHASFSALYLAKRWQIACILGSATPSLEFLALARQNRLIHARLDTRAQGQVAPLRLTDARTQHLSIAKIDGTLVPSYITSEVHTRIRQTLDDGNQVLVFLNRRGFAPILLCQGCGWQADCVHCHAHMSLRKRPSRLTCHHCGYHAFAPTLCPSCHSQNLVDLGTGTAKLFEELHALYANPQLGTPVPIYQIDADTTKNAHDWTQLYANLTQNDSAILVGTQMLAKGHHLPKVALSIILDMDFAFFAPDFRAPEYAAQTIIQVAGRAGRDKIRGETLLLSQKIDHPHLQILSTKGYRAFADILLDERALLCLPPFAYSALVRLSSTNLNALDKYANAVPKLNIPIRLISPSPDKINNRYLRLWWFVAPTRRQLHHALDNLPTPPNIVRQIIDIDPVHF